MTRESVSFPTWARVMCAVQQPLASSAFTDVMGVPASKSLPSWYLVAQDDEAIPHPAEVAGLAEKAAETVAAAAAPRAPKEENIG